MSSLASVSYDPASAMSCDREKCLQIGMIDYVSKSINSKDLQDVIEKVFNEHSKSA